MTKQEQAAVKQWLHSIKRSELAIINLTKAIEEIETRRESPPTWMPRYEMSGGGGNGGSKQESWVEFVDQYDARKKYLEQELTRIKNKVEQYNNTLDNMNNEPQWGSLAVQIIKAKYYKHISPDFAIFTYHLFCSKETFYRTHRKALQFIVDVLPNIFKKTGV